MLTGGNVADVIGAHHLLAVSPTAGCFIADKAYDADDVRAFLPKQGSKVVISLMPTRTGKPDTEPVAYRMRNVIERAFRKLKDRRAFATRYDKLARNFLAATCLAVAITLWIKWVQSIALLWQIGNFRDSLGQFCVIHREPASEAGDEWKLAKRS